MPNIFLSAIAGPGATVIFRMLMDPMDRPQGSEHRFAAGDVIIRQGSYPGQVYWVVEGRLETHVVDADGRTILLGEIYEGEFFGEMAAFTGRAASANVRAVTACRLVCIGYEAFFNLIEESPHWNRELLRSISLRAQRVYSKVPLARVLWLQPWSEGVDLTAFLNRLVPLVGKFGPCAVVRMEDAADWKEHLEALRMTSSFVCLVGDFHAMEWAAFCRTESDKCLCIAQPLERPLSRDQLVQNEKSVENELVLLHSAETAQPKGTKAWLERGEFGFHYHVREDSSSDWKRLARCLTGNAIGLVCSGGGARGAAHLGMSSALSDVGIPVDYMIGTSAGALMTVCQAMEMPRVEYLDFLEHISRNSRKLNDYTFPFMSLLAGKQFNEILRKYAGDWQIEDLWLPFACVSSSLSSGKVVVHRHGALFPALKASTAIPGIFPPQYLNGEILVDGGLLNNAPTDVAKAFPAGKLILSDMSKWSPVHFKGRFPDTASGWRLLFQYLNPFRKERFRPALPTVILKSYELSAMHLQAERLLNHPPDLTIHIPVHDFGTLDFDGVRRIWDLGYAFGLEQGMAWKKQLDLE